MAAAEETRRIVPRGDLEGSLGSGEKRWEKAYVGNVGNVYNSVADMKDDLELMEGSTVVTKGYHAINDGGHGFYNIREKLVSDVDDDGSIIFLDNGKVAELIVNDAVSVKQFGAKGDGVTDDTNAFRNAFLVDKLYIPAGNYKITDYLIGFNKVIDDGTYTNIKPIFTTKNRLETISRFGMKANFTTPEDNKMYGEAMTFNTKTQKIIVCCEGFGYSPAKNILLVLNKDTYAIEETYDLPHPYAFNVLSYNEQDNVIYANGGNTCYRINGDDMTDYTTFSLPDNGSHAAHDNITNTDVVVSRDWGTNYNITINVYSNGFAEKLHTVTTKANIIEDTAFQDICAYNGKVYVLTFKNLYEIDVVTGDVNIISISTLQEIEGCTFIDDVFYVFAHQISSNYVEYIYSYQYDYEPQFYNRLLPNYIQRTLDVSLDKFVAMGDYYVDSADTTDKNYPTGETKGYLHVVNRSGMGDDNSLIMSEQEFHSLTAPYSVYQRLYFRSGIGWTSWQKVDHINSTGNGWIRYENGLQLCWGKQEITTDVNVSGGYPYRGQVNITFPVPFSSTPCVFSSVNDSINYWISGAKNATVSKFLMMMCGNQNNATRESEWYAIGYWK